MLRGFRGVVNCPQKFFKQFFEKEELERGPARPNCWANDRAPEYMRRSNHLARESMLLWFGRGGAAERSGNEARYGRAMRGSPE